MLPPYSYPEELMFVYLYFKEYRLYADIGLFSL